MMRLEKVNGPECDNCGCTESEVVQRFKRWGKPYLLRQCGACGVEFQAPDAESNGQAKPTDDDRGITYLVNRCPKCGSSTIPVTSTRRPIRWHKCGDCGQTFKSVEGR